MQTSQKTTPAILFLLIATTALVLSCTHARVFASQLPGGGITFPALLPDPGQDIFVPIQTIDLHRATDIVWASILGTEEKDPVLANLFDNAPILVSGVMDIEGKEYLYLGVERAYHNRHGSKHIYQALRKRFPGTPIYVEPSDGIELQAETRSREDATEDNTLFRDTFTDGLAKWTTESFLSDNPGWEARALDETGNIVARTQDCPILCNLTTIEPLNLEDHETVQLTFDRWIDREVDNGEGLTLHVGNNGIYRTVGQWREGDSAWRTETVTLRNLSGNVTIRFTAIPSSVFNADPKTIAIDNVTITETPQETTEGGLTLRISAQPTEAEPNQPITLSVTVQNTGTMTEQGTIRLYRHLSKTTTPTQGGIRLPQTADTGSLTPNGQATKTIQTTAPTPDTYHYYACIEDVCSASPATVTVREQEPTETTDTFSLSKTNASQNNVDAQSPFSLTTTVTNTGDTTTNPATVSFYLHEHATTTPNIGGTKIVQSAQTKELAPNESETLSVTTVAQNVTATTVVRYYACIEDVCSAPATVRIREGTDTPDTDVPNTPEPTTNTNNAITKLTASPWEPESGTPIIVRFTVQNTNTKTKDITVRVYQHTSQTARPTNGTPVGEITVESIAPKTSVTEYIMVTVPTVTRETPVYYHACVGGDCAGPATVTVYAKVAVPAPPYRDCYNGTPTRSTPMGGDSFLSHPFNLYEYVRTCGTITLGGLETIDGTRGFVVSGHVLDPIISKSLFTSTDMFIGHSQYRDTLQIENFLGKAFKTSSRRTEGDKTVIVADAAFIAHPYPHTSDCSLMWSNRDGQKFCLDLVDDGHVVERVSPLVIRGKGGEVYTVIGSRQPTGGLKVNVSGGKSGIGEEGEVSSDRLLISRLTKGNLIYKYLYTTAKTDTMYGDSGSPVFTIPDTGGNVHIVGIHVGVFKGQQAFSSWEDVTRAFDLKPIAP